jgi:tetratricopeptide (TPR) repeat protein
MKRLPEALKRQTNNYAYIVSNVASTLHDVAGPRDGLAFLVERIEQEPRWLRYQGQDGWSQHSHYLAYWRTEVKDLGEREPRLLKIVTDEIRRDLHSRQARNRNMYVKHNSYFWAEREDAFALVAEEVLEKNMNSSATIAYIAEYMFSGLGRQNRAIEILAEAHRREVLDENVQAQLINYLHHTQRFAESIAILEPLVERRPENMTFRVQLMHAYFRAQQQEKLLALLSETDKFFHEKKLWSEGNIEALAKSTLENQLFEQSVAYYKEVIGLRERTAPHRGVGDGTLSAYYMGLAQAHSGLKQTPEAVEAAGAAIVAWGPRHQQDRAHALATLRSVLEQSPDLDAFVKKLDAQVAETGLENPIVRKAVGSVYLARSNFSGAIAQLKRAVEVQPNDAETHQLLVSALDQSGDKEGAIEQLFASIELSRRELSLYKNLAERYQAAGNQKQAERAYLTIVEMLPGEFESHTMLAEVRQQQSRWSDAADHWQRVAEIRKLEPTGLLKLAAAQLQLKQWDKAQETLRTLEKRDWPARFNDVHNQIQQLQRDLHTKRS